MVLGGADWGTVAAGDPVPTPTDPQQLLAQIQAMQARPPLPRFMLEPRNAIPARRDPVIQAAVDRAVNRFEEALARNPQF